MNEEFAKLVSDIRHMRFTKAPINERDIEHTLEQYLKSKNYTVIRQNATKIGRTDLLVRIKQYKICIELKTHASPPVLKQLDKYSIENDAIILVAWHVSQTIKDVFTKAKSQSEIPIEVIELKMCQPLW